MNPYQSIIEKIAPQHRENYVVEALEFFSYTLSNSPDNIPYSDSFPEEFKEIASEINTRHAELQQEALARVDEEVPTYPFPADDTTEDVPWEKIEKSALERLEE